MIISIVNQKGGVGKTTLAVNLAGMIQAAGKKLLLVDIWAANDTVDLIRKITIRTKGITARLLVYRKIPGTRIGAEAREALKAYPFKVYKTEITQKIAAVEAMISGQTLTEFSPNSKSAAEFNALANEILSDFT